MNGGMDIEMPSTIHWGTKLVDAVRNGSVREDVIDDAVLVSCGRKFVLHG